MLTSPSTAIAITITAAELARLIAPVSSHDEIKLGLVIGAFAVAAGLSYWRTANPITGINELSTSISKHTRLLYLSVFFILNATILQGVLLNSDPYRLSSEIPLEAAIAANLAINSAIALAAIGVFLVWPSLWRWDPDISRVEWLKINGEKIRSPAIAKREYLAPDGLARPFLPPSSQ